MHFYWVKTHNIAGNNLNDTEIDRPLIQNYARGVIVIAQRLIPSTGYSVVMSAAICCEHKVLLSLGGILRTGDRGQ